MVEIATRTGATARPRTPLSKARVLDTAVAPADEGGVDALSMRRLCSTRNLDLVRSLGAAHVIDYTREDFTDPGGRGRYDLVLDNVGNHPLGRLRRVLTPEGTLVANGGGSPGHVFGAMGAMLRVLVVNAFVRQQLRVILPAAPAGPTHEDLVAVTALIEAGELAPVVDRTYTLADAAEGVRHVERGHARGKVVVVVQ